MKGIIRFFDKMEDRVRAVLSRRPIIYAFIGGTAIVLFWRGVWMLADDINLSGMASIIISTIILLSTGLFVSFFIGDTIIISGIKKGKRLDEKVASELKTEAEVMDDIQHRLSNIEKQLKAIRKNSNIKKNLL